MPLLEVELGAVFIWETPLEVEVKILSESKARNCCFV
jgi:hypothetical protein